MKKFKDFRRLDESLIRSYYKDRNGNKFTMTYDTVKQNLSLINKARVSKDISSVMMMRNDVRGTSARKEELSNAVREANPKSAEDLRKILEKSTKLRWDSNT